MFQESHNISWIYRAKPGTDPTLQTVLARRLAERGVRLFSFIIVAGIITGP